jgi:hypothetical protein
MNNDKIIFKLREDINTEIANLESERDYIICSQYYEESQKDALISNIDNRINGLINNHQYEEDDIMKVKRKYWYTGNIILSTDDELKDITTSIPKSAFYTVAKNKKTAINNIRYKIARCISYDNFNIILNEGKIQEIV